MQQIIWNVLKELDVIDATWHQLPINCADQQNVIYKTIHSNITECNTTQ